MTKLTLIAAVAALALATLPAEAQQQKPREPNRKTQVEQCGESFGYLRRVFATEVAAIDQYERVWVTPVCLGDEGLMRSDGNAAYLRPTIAENEVLVAALTAKDFRPEDVFAVRMMGDDTINLYVHRFGR